MILQGMHYQVEILFPVSQLKTKTKTEQTIWNSISYCSFEEWKNWFSINNRNIEFKTVQSLAQEAYEKLTILHAFTVSILSGQ